MIPSLTGGFTTMIGVKMIDFEKEKWQWEYEFTTSDYNHHPLADESDFFMAMKEIMGEDDCS